MRYVLKGPLNKCRDKRRIDKARTKLTEKTLKPGFHYTSNATTTAQKGKDCLEKFCDYIRQEANRLYHMFPEKSMDPFTPKQ